MTDGVPANWPSAFSAFEPSDSFTPPILGATILTVAACPFGGHLDGVDDGAIRRAVADEDANGPAFQRIGIFAR
jgi:hypothetical protein